MSKKYKEIMDQIQVTDAMKQRILWNAEKKMKEKSRTVRYLPAAACIMMLIVGGLTMPQLLDRGNKRLPDQAETEAEVVPGETMEAFAESGTFGEQEELGGQTGALVGNGMVEMTSLSELSQALGFSVPEVKNLPFEVADTVYINGWNEYAQIEYQNQSQTQTVLFRKARKTDDISGDYNFYSDVIEIIVNEVPVTLKGNGGQYQLAVWQEDGFSYSLSYEPGGEEDAFAGMIQSIQ